VLSREQSKLERLQKKKWWQRILDVKQDADDILGTMSQVNESMNTACVRPCSFIIAAPADAEVDHYSRADRAGTCEDAIITGCTL
jgi:hypothetical protein